MPEFLKIKFMCDIDTLKIEHNTKNDLKKLLNIIEFLKRQSLDEIWKPRSKITFGCEIENTVIDHVATNPQSFRRLLDIIEFIRVQYFEDTHSKFNIHTVVYITSGEYAGKFGVVQNVYHEFIEQSDYDVATICIRIGEKSEWINAEDAILTDELKPEDFVKKTETNSSEKTEEEIEAIITAQSGVIEAPPAEPEPELHMQEYISPCIGKSVILIPTGKETKAEKYLLGKTLKIKNVVSGSFALQYGDQTIIWRKHEEFTVIPDEDQEVVAPQPVSKEPSPESPPIYHPIQTYSIEKKKEKEESIPEVTTMSQDEFKKDRLVKPKEGVLSPFQGVGRIKRVNIRSGDILVEFSNGTEWVKRINYDVVPDEVKP